MGGELLERLAGHDAEDVEFRQQPMLSERQEDRGRLEAVTPGNAVEDHVRNCSDDKCETQGNLL